jgi:small subunit ribosomal protein S4e
MKRMFAPSKWCLDKLSGVYATRPSQGPHKLRECLPLSVLLRNRLKYALSQQEVLKIVKQKEGLIKVDNKVRRDHKFPVGFQDVVSIEKTGENFRMLYDTKGRFQAVPVDNKEAGWKLCKVVRKTLGKNKIPYIVTHDGRTIRFPHPDIKKNDTIKFNFETNDVETVLKFDNGATVFATGGNNIGRVGVLQHVEHHPGSYEIAHVKDSRGHSFATRLSNIFVIGSKEAMCSLPRGSGIKLSLVEERDKRDRRYDDEE